MKKHNSQQQTKDRRRTVISRLEEQLKSKTKNTKEGTIILTEKDIERITKEISILKTRI